MITWGIVGNSHDASLAVFKNGECLWAALSKDFSDVPNDPDLNWTIVEVAKRIAGPPDQIVWYERPMLKTLRQLIAGQGWLFDENNIKRYLARWDITAPIKYTTHHLSHAAYAYYTQDHDDCAVICLDSIGEFETLTMWHGKNGKLKKIYTQGYPHSIGLFYSAMTQRCSLIPNKEEYLMTQWADKGDPFRFYSHIKRDILGDGFRKQFSLKHNLHRGCRWWRPELDSPQDHYDIAAATQMIFEETVSGLSYKAFRDTGSNYLALAGGGALNSRAVGKISNRWDSVHVPQNPGDPGSCIGAVLARTRRSISLDNVWHKKNA